jgi:hypothetical protein
VLGFRTVFKRYLKQIVDEKVQRRLHCLWVTPKLANFLDACFINMDRALFGSSAYFMQKKRPEVRNANNKTNELTFHYIKSSDFRIIRADGITGNISPRGDIFLSFYSERFALPDSVTHRISESGQIGEIVKVATKSEGVVRELEAGITMDLPTARSFIVWLSNMIAKGEDSARQEVQEEGDK